MADNREWWRTFFSGLTVEGWLAAVNDEQTNSEAEFIVDKLQTAAPARLLDVPCGGGRLALALAARGFQVTGVDISAEFLAHARAQAAQKQLKVDWHQGEMLRLPWKGEFAAAFCFGNSFGYYDDEGNADFLHAVSAALKPGGHFLLEACYLTESLLQALQDRSWYQLGDLLMLAHRRYDHHQGRLHVDYTWIKNGRTEKNSMSARLYTFREISQLLEAAGFQDAQSYSSLTSEPFHSGCPRLLMVVRKKL